MSNFSWDPRGFRRVTERYQIVSHGICFRYHAYYNDNKISGKHKKIYIHTSIYIYTEIEWHDFVFSYIVLKSLVCVKCYFYFKNYSVIRLKRGLKVVVVGFYYIIIIHLGNSCYKIRKKLPNLQLIMWPVLCVLFLIKYGVRVQFIFGMMSVYSRCAEYSKTIYYDMLWYIINIFVMTVQFNKYINISDI